MNLVKAQEYAQSLPLAELKKYADGFDPAMIPPWLATGEMQAKMKRAEMANNLQGASTGPMPSVKEQVEQKAGIMALQQAQQRAQAQQMMQPRMGAGPVPEGTPQPRPQPQQAVGLNQLPSNIQMAGGGIVAFAKGDKVKGNGEDESSQFVQDISELPQAFDDWKQRARAEDALKAEQDRRMEQRKQEMLEARRKASLFNYLFGSPSSEKEGLSKLAELSNTPLAATEKPPAAAPGASLDAETQKVLNLAATRPNTGVNTNPALKPNLPPAVVNQNTKTLGTNQRPPNPAAPAAPAAPAPDSMEALFRKSLENKPKERTVQELIDEQNAIRAGTGLGEEAGKAQLDRIAALQKQYEASKPSGLDELIRVFGQAGASKGLSGTGPAYTAMQAQKRAQDLDMAQKINELMSGVETTQRAEKTGVAGKVSEGRAKTLEQQAQFDREMMQQLGSARGQDVQAASAKNTADTHLKGVMAQVAARGDARANLTPAQRGQIADKAVDNVTAQIKQDMRLSMQVARNPALRDQMIQRETERLFQAATGITMDAAPGAGRPGGTSSTPPPGAVREVKR